MFQRSVFCSPQPPNPWALISKNQASRILSYDESLSQLTYNDFPTFSLCDNYLSLCPTQKTAPNMDSFCQRLTEATNYFILQAKQRKEVSKQTLKACCNEMNRFLGVVSFINDNRFPNYVDHFQLNEQSLIQSPIRKIMNLERFHFLASFFELSTEEKYSNSYIETYNSFMDSFQMNNRCLRIPKVLVLGLMKLWKPEGTIGAGILLLYDEEGFLLKGSLVQPLDFMNELNYLAKIENILKDYRGTQSMVIVEQEIAWLQHLEYIQALGFHVMVRLNISRERENYEENEFVKMSKTITYTQSAQSDTENKTIYCYNEMNDFLIMNNTTKNALIWVGVRNGFTVENSDPFESVLNFIDEIESKINSVWKISIWDYFDKSRPNLALEPILFMFSSFINNSFLTQPYKFFDFPTYKHCFIQNLLIPSPEEKATSFHSISQTLGHSPKRLSYCTFCKVCKKDPLINPERKNARKTKYTCELCSKNYNKKIPLCVVGDCWKLYHNNPNKYNERKNYKRQTMRSGWTG